MFFNEYNPPLKEWALMHQTELNKNWENIENNKQFDKIAPLD